MLRPILRFEGTFEHVNTAYTCLYCGVLQSCDERHVDVSAVRFITTRCINCSDVTIKIQLYKLIGGDAYPEKNPFQIFPSLPVRLSKNFQFAPREVMEAYLEACLLVPIHSGAAGAYARRTLELILDNLGYKSASLAETIRLARAETDPDKKMSSRSIRGLDFIREIGNFALHVRRDQELVIVPIDDSEVEACMEIIEEIIEDSFEAPAEEYIRVIGLNEKLSAAGKRTITLPNLHDEIIQSIQDVLNSRNNAG